MTAMAPQIDSAGTPGYRAGAPGILSSFGSFSGMPDAPIVSLDITLHSRENLGFQPLRHSLFEIKSALKQKLHFHDGNDWLKRFWFSVKEGGLPVIRVEAGTPAEAGGLKVCDVIVAVDGKDSKVMTQTKVVSKIKKGLEKHGAVTLSVVRCTALPYDPSSCALFADQGTRSKSQSYSVNISIPIKPELTAFGFTPLKYSLTETDLPKMEKHMVKETRNRLPFAQWGLPVQSVDPDGPAASAGLQQWDVIVSVNGASVQNKTSPQVIQLVKQTMTPLNLSRENEDLLVLTVLRSLNPVETETSPKKSAFHRAISGLHWLSSPGKGGKTSQGSTSFGTRASEIDSGDIVVADITSFDAPPLRRMGTM